MEELERQAARPRERDRGVRCRGASRSAQREIEHYALFDYVVVNDDVQRAFDELRSIVDGRASAQARRRAPWRSRYCVRGGCPERRRRSDDANTFLASSEAAASTKSRASSDVEEVACATLPSAHRATSSCEGASDDTTLLFLPRHGRGHGIAPHEIDVPRQRLRAEEARRDAPREHQRGRLDEGGDRRRAISSSSISSST